MTVVLYDLVVVGGGAAGIVAAIVAARTGASVLILEKNEKLGKKLLATGNGRCNLGNDDLSLDNFVCHDLTAAKQVLERFGTAEAVQFFAGLGLVIVSEEGRWYPRTKQASSVLEVLQQELRQLRVEVITSSPVYAIVATDTGFTLTHKAGSQAARLVLLATGGMAAPQLGCSGDGYALAKACGHSILPPSPALVGLKIKSLYRKALSGLRVKAEVSIPELNLSERGEIIFTDYGLSGIPVFDLTRQIGHRQGLTLRLRLAYDEREEVLLGQFWRERIKHLAHKYIDEVLTGYLPQQLIVPVLREIGLAPKTLAGQLPEECIARLCLLLWSWDFPIIGLNTWEQAQTTWGGIPLNEVDPATLTSHRQPGIFFAGEILDVHGRCGGYNLHWAFASGFVAAQAIARCHQF
ncbi:MAG: Ferredoxin--NADP reductase [Firmicutes bacterium]|nr:Ferredoxin--NADP reductase [Bacillota bacterium]